MAQELLNDFTAYIEDLCRRHVEVNHSAGEKHFVRLESDEMLQEGKSRIYYPVVTLERLTVTYSGDDGGLVKSRSIELMFLDHISDWGDFNKITNTWSRMEGIAEDFLLKMKADKRSRSAYPYLRYFKIDGAQIDYVENIATHLWGVLLSLNMDMPLNDCLPDGRFR